MKKIANLILALGLLIGCSATAQESMQSAENLKKRVTQTVNVDYLLHLPTGYKADGKKKWPLILFLHGAGERGDNLDLVKVHGPPKIAPGKKDFPFIVVSPQCPAGGDWDPKVLITLLDHIEATHAVDTKRIYLTGLSMGGYGTWILGIEHPTRFAAIAPICGGGPTIKVRLARRNADSPLKTLPIWAFHGEKDTVVPPTESRRMIATFKMIGNENIKLTTYPEARHDSWTETYNNPELYKWFLSHSR